MVASPLLSCTHVRRPGALLTMVLVCACGARTGLPTPQEESVSEGGSTEGGGGAGGGGAPPDCEIVDGPTVRLTGIARDFHDSHPDFEQGILADDRAIVAAELGGDGLPVYAGGRGTATTNGRVSFDQWFRDTEAVNLAMRFDMLLQPRATNERAFADETFFIVDDQLFGNEQREHNFHFTLELHARFLYSGGEVLHFRGDDDLWVFLNDRLAVDLGGVHSSETVTLRLDDIATAIQLHRGEVFPLDLFFAERQTSGSVFELTLETFTVCR